MAYVNMISIKEKMILKNRRSIYKYQFYRRKDQNRLLYG